LAVTVEEWEASRCRARTPDPVGRLPIVDNSAAQDNTAMATLGMDGPTTARAPPYRRPSSSRNILESVPRTRVELSSTTRAAASSERMNS